MPHSHPKEGCSLSSLLQTHSEAALHAAAHGPMAAAPQPLPDIDSADRENPLAAADLALDIHQYYKRVEPKFRVAHDYMKHQADISEKMRATLTDWLVEVHHRYKVGITAMLIASKYEEIWAPQVGDFVHISDKAYTKDQVLGCEQLILSTLNFSLTVPTCYNFLARFQKAANIHLDRQASLLSSYCVELAIVNAGMLRYTYSLISTAAVYTTLRALGRPNPFPLELARHSSYCLEAVLPCAAALVEAMQKAPTHPLRAVYKKYCSYKLSEVAKTPVPVAILEDAAALRSRAAC